MNKPKCKCSKEIDVSIFQKENYRYTCPECKTFLIGFDKDSNVMVDVVNPETGEILQEHVTGWNSEGEELIAFLMINGEKKALTRKDVLRECVFSAMDYLYPGSRDESYPYKDRTESEALKDFERFSRIALTHGLQQEILNLNNDNGFAKPGEYENFLMEVFYSKEAGDYLAVPFAIPFHGNIKNNIKNAKFTKTADFLEKHLANHFKIDRFFIRIYPKAKALGSSDWENLLRTKQMIDAFVLHLFGNPVIYDTLLSEFVEDQTEFSTQSESDAFLDSYAATAGDVREAKLCFLGLAFIHIDNVDFPLFDMMATVKSAITGNRQTETKALECIAQDLGITSLEGNFAPQCLPMPLYHLKNFLLGISGSPYPGMDTNIQEQVVSAMKSAFKRMG